MEPGLWWGWRGLASKSQTEVRSRSSLVRVSLVTHTSPVGHQTQSRDGMVYFGAEFQERHFLYPHPAPILSSCHPAAESGQLGPPSPAPCKHPSVGNTRISGDGRTKGLNLSEKTSQALGSPCILTFWQKFCLARQHGPVTPSAPCNGTRQILPFLTFRVHQADCQPEPRGFKTDRRSPPQLKTSSC